MAQGKARTTVGDGYSLRGWYHTLYSRVLRGNKVLDVGSGTGVDGITFAQAGAEVTFVDIAESNLRVVKRLCEIQNIRNVNFLYLEKAKSLGSLGRDFDFIWCQGSMIAAPFDIAKEEVETSLNI